MTDSKRKSKQMFFAIIFLAITVGPGLYYYFTSFGSSTCFNNKWDIDEEGVDCGGSCADCLAEPVPPGVLNFKQIGTEIIPLSNNNYDVVAEIENPNEYWGAESLNYRILLYDDKNNLVASAEGKNFIMPGTRQHKYIVKHLEELEGLPASAKVALTKIVWKEFPSSLPKPDFPIYYKKISGNQNANTPIIIEGEVRNSSINGFNKVNISVIVRGEKGNIIGAASTDMSTLKSEEKRRFSVAWEEPFTELIGDNSVEWNVDVNILDKNNFMEKIYEPVKEEL